MSKSSTMVSKPKLRAGGNPQMAKADGDGSVQAYIAAVPGWKQGVVRRMDLLISDAVPGVHKAVRWSSPMYGVKGQGWFASVHVFTKVVKITFLKGTSLSPPPSGGNAKEARWIDVAEAGLDEAQLAQLVQWVHQAAAIPGWGKF